MTDYAFWATVIASACLAVELVNTSALGYIIHWTRSAGANIVGKISQSLNLKQGKGSIANAIRGIVDKVSEPESDTDEPIETPWGTFTVPEIRKFAGQFKAKAQAGEVTLPGGKGDMDVLGKLASGGKVDMMDALPLLKTFLMPGPKLEGSGALGNGGGHGSSEGNQWDS